MDKKWAPGAVRFSGVELRRSLGGSYEVELSWEPAADRDEDVLGYRVFLSEESRGWCYQDFAGAQVYAMSSELRFEG